MTLVPDAQPHLINQPQQWSDLLRRLQRVSLLAVDLESNGFHCYPEKVCLIQLGFHRHIALVDTIALPRLKGLKELLENRAITKVFHSCDNDVRALQRDFHIHVKNIFDTALAAKLTGSTHLGLANVLNEFLGITLDKNKKIQRQDWSKRPLDDASLAYAAADVHYLPTLKRLLGRQLIQLGRLTWFQEESRWLEKITYQPPATPENLFWQVKGVKTLTGRQMRLLQSLCVLREQLARDFNRPPYRVMSNETLLQLVQKPHQPYHELKGLGAILRHKKVKDLQEAIKQGLHGKPINPNDRPVSGRARKSKVDKESLQRLKQWREREALKFKVDPSIIWPMQALEALAQQPQLIFQPGALPEVRQWQNKHFKRAIVDLLAHQEQPEE